MKKFYITAFCTALTAAPIEAFNRDCFRITTPFGDEVEDKDIVKSDFDLLMALDEPKAFNLNFVVTCGLNGKVTGMRFGLLDSRTNEKMDEVYLNTIGRSSQKSVCESVWLPAGERITLLKLYRMEGRGIVGSFFQLSNGDYHAYGDVTTDDVKSTVFDDTRILVGQEGVTSRGYIKSLSLVTMFTDDAECTRIIEPSNEGKK